MGHAVGLGEISTYSALNQPLNAQIEMVSTSPDEVDGITVKLAPESVFEQVGITRSPVLNHLRFKPAVVNGTPVIKVSSDRPIQEPFVNFIVEVAWPKGKLLREYTVLLDPPVLGGGAPAAPATAKAPADIAEVPIFVSEPEGGEAVEAAPLVTTPVETAEPVATTEVMAGEGLPPFAGEAPADLETFTVSEAPEAVVEEVEVVEEPELLPLEETEMVTTAPVADLEDTENWLPPFVGGAFDPASADIETYAVAESEPLVVEEGAEMAPTGDTYQVMPGDTLFGIARRARQGTAANIHQMMVAIQRSNPAAFIGNDMNRLKAGYILRMPDPAEAASISRAEAKAAVMAAVAAQGDAFQQFKSKAGQNAVPQTPVSVIPEPVAGQTAGLADLESRVKEAAPQVIAGGEIAERPNLEILTPDGKGDSAAGGEAGEGVGVATSAALVKEQLESKARETEELASRAAELESMIADKDRLIELKDEKLADLQSEVAGETGEPAPTAETAGGEAPEPALGEAPAAAGEAAPAGGGLLQESADAEAGGLTESEKAAEPVVEEVVAETAAEEEVAPENTSLLAEETTGEAAQQGGEEAATAAPPEEQDESTGLVDRLKESPGALAGVGAGVLLMSALAWLIFRRKEEEPVVIGDEAEETIDDATSVGGEDVAAEQLVEDDLSRTTEVSADEVMIAAAHAEEPVAPAAAEEEDEPGTLVGTPEELAAGEEDEVLSEANVYLAYGLHDQAIDLLKPAVEAHPERNDYIAKLAEAYHAAGDKEAFIATAQKMHGPADGPDKKLFQRVAVMGKDIAPEHEMFVNADTGDLTLTAITRRPDALTETNVSDTMTIDADEIDLTPDDTQLPDLDELSKSLQMEESEALQELRESAMDLEEESPDVTNIHTPAPDFGEIKDEALDDVKEGFADLTSAADESVAELDTKTLTMAMGNAADDLSLDELEDDFNSLTTGADEISTKLDLAKAYIDMGDDEGAREALEEVIASGNEEQQGAARKLLEQLK